MTRMNKLLLATLGLVLFTGCGGSGSSDSTRVDEFISLDKKANFEYGYVSDGTKKETLSYLGALLYSEEGKEKQYLGYLGVFAENKNEQILAISSKDGEEPNTEMMYVNLPDIANGYKCENFTMKEGESAYINNASIWNITAKDCQGQGSNEGKKKNFEVLLTQSMFVAGTSRLEIKGTKAYLKTDYKINKNLSLVGTGALGTRAYNQIFDLIQNHPEVTTIVEGHISGSIHDDINMQTGRLVRKAGLSTHITKNSNISSGGVDLFCSGIIRTMEDGAKVGVHSWAGDGVEAGKLPKDSPLHKNQIDYFTEMLGSPAGEEFYFYTIDAAPAAGMHQMNRAEMQEYQLLAE